ncbi:MAG: CRISPR-associated protein Cas4 [Chitinophagales bacterium]|nr:CRISPR-associated protein Cas4 [Chitinophagales bacterium]
MPLTATHIAYYHLCRRKLWLFANGITMEHTSDLVADGRFIHENSYERRADKFSEVEIDGSKIDFYDAKNKVIHETKRSAAREVAHGWQVKYYIYLLKKSGIEGVSGKIEYPVFHQCTDVLLTQDDEIYIEKTIRNIEELTASPACPPKIEKKKCRYCSYFDFCWSEEY